MQNRVYSKELRNKHLKAQLRNELLYIRGSITQLINTYIKYAVNEKMSGS